MSVPVLPSEVVQEQEAPQDLSIGSPLLLGDRGGCHFIKHHNENQATGIIL